MAAQPDHATPLPTPSFALTCSFKLSLSSLAALLDSLLSALPRPLRRLLFHAFLSALPDYQPINQTTTYLP
jgi:hypothetical protein